MSTTVPEFTVSRESLLTARQALYRFLSMVFVDPRSGTWHTLADPVVQQCVRAAAELLRDQSAASNNRLARGERPLAELVPERVFGRLPDSPEALNSEYERTFGLLVSSDCPPYGTEYINGKFTFQRSHALADLGGFYRAFGLQTSQEHPDRADHISLELEFMAFVIGLERAACQSVANDGRDRAELAEVCRDAQARFLDEHLAWWGPTFSRLLEVQDSTSFYAAAGRLLSSLIPAERALLGVSEPATLTEPNGIEPPEECEGCLLKVD